MNEFQKWCEDLVLILKEANEKDHETRKQILEIIDDAYMKFQEHRKEIGDILAQLGFVGIYFSIIIITERNLCMTLDKNI